MRLIHRLLIGLAIAAAMLAFYDRRADTDLFNVGSSNQALVEQWQGVDFTAASVSEIRKLISNHQAIALASADCDRPAILWLGNSQLHYVNQYRAGDHLAPYWLRQRLHCGAPVGMSLPNANLQELYVMAAKASSRLPVRAILLELCFDDLREDGLRAEFSGFLDAVDRQRVVASEVGAGIISGAESAWGDANANEENDGLRGFVQKSVEDRLDNALSGIWPLWGSRSDLRTQVMVDLYFTRNGLLGITPSTTRKMIAPRYSRNMSALRQLFRDARGRGVAVIAYIAPIRQDVPLPYDLGEYTRWKSAVADMVRAEGATLVNLEALVPAAEWGATSKNDIDFMHFRGEGHRLLANALLPYVQRVR